MPVKTSIGKGGHLIFLNYFLSLIFYQILVVFVGKFDFFGYCLKNVTVKKCGRIGKRNNVNQFE